MARPKHPSLEELSTPFERHHADDTVHIAQALMTLVRSKFSHEAVDIVDR
jgi:hypothetical protein